MLRDSDRLRRGQRPTLRRPSYSASTSPVWSLDGPFTTTTSNSVVSSCSSAARVSPQALRAVVGVDHDRDRPRHGAASICWRRRRSAVSSAGESPVARVLGQPGEEVEERLARSGRPCSRPGGPARPPARRPRPGRRRPRSDRDRPAAPTGGAGPVDEVLDGPAQRGHVPGRDQASEAADHVGQVPGVVADHVAAGGEGLDDRHAVALVVRGDDEQVGGLEERRHLALGEIRMEAELPRRAVVGEALRDLGEHLGVGERRAPDQVDRELAGPVRPQPLGQGQQVADPLGPHQAPDEQEPTGRASPATPAKVRGESRATWAGGRCSTDSRSSSTPTERAMPRLNSLTQATRCARRRLWRCTRASSQPARTSGRSTSVGRGGVVLDHEGRPVGADDEQ